MSHAANERRRRRLAAIHTAKRALHLDNDTYRDLIERVSALSGPAQRSAGDLTEGQIIAVLEEFKRLGGLKPAAKAAGKPRNFDQLPLMITKVEAMLASMQLPWSYADAIALRQFKVEKVAWCRKQEQLQAIIAALYVEQQKRELLAGIERVREQQGLTVEQLEARYELTETRNWRRSLPVLKTLSEALTGEQMEQEPAPR